LILESQELLNGKFPLLKKCKSTEKRIRIDGFEMFFLNKEFKTNLRGKTEGRALACWK